MTSCGLNRPALDLPDAGQGACCIGAAVYGPSRCTCWVPRYDRQQQEINPGLPLPPIPVRMCGDCAFRGNSPERRGEAGYNGDASLLDELVRNREPFYCHQGIRKPIAYRHPSGAEIPGHPAAYDPPIRDGVPYKADGTPADLCAGWLLRCAKETGGEPVELPGGVR